jgi:hypothetical protein
MGATASLAGASARRGPRPLLWYPTLIHSPQDLIGIPKLGEVCMAKTAAQTLTEAQRDSARQILEQVRTAITAVAAGDPALAFALRRYVYVRLSHDERSKPGAEASVEDAKVRRAAGTVRNLSGTARADRSYPPAPPQRGSGIHRGEYLARSRRMPSKTAGSPQLFVEPWGLSWKFTG